MPIARRLNWVRSRHRWVAGVCYGIAPQLGLRPTELRLLWFCSAFFLGLGLFIYAICWLCLPHEKDGTRIEESKVLGVCTRLSRLINIELGLIRCLFTVSLFFSLGGVAIVYITLFFFLPYRAPLVQDHGKGLYEQQA